MSPPLERIVSGGQTGVDRAGLDAAEKAGLERGGWCPAGRRAEDGVIPASYPVVPCASKNYAVRTRMNVEDSDGTLIVADGPLGGGTLLTRQLCERSGKPFLVVDLSTAPDPKQVRAWIRSQRLETVNVAGPRASHDPTLSERAYAFLLEALDPALL